MTYTKAIKLPKGGAVAMTFDNMQASMAEILAKKHCLKPEPIYDWANKYKIDLQKHAHILCRLTFSTDLLEDLLNDTDANIQAAISQGGLNHG